MRVITLGTSGAIPTLRRSLPAVAVQREGKIFLFDCGEGTQMQMMKAKLSISKLERIFISHLHGDHVVGLPGLLMSLAQVSRQRPIFIYGPTGIKDYVLANKKHLNFYCEYEIVLEEINAGKITEEGEYHFEAVTLDHNHLTLGYALIERERPGKFLLEKARDLGVEEGPLFGKLQRGEDVKLENGKVIHPQDVLEKPRRGRKIIYATDTRPCRKVADLSREADVLIHDGMFSPNEEKEARERGHSTVTQVAQMAKEAGVTKLILTHISSRYPNDRFLLKEAREIFPQAIIARDLMEIEVPLSP
jgi:ribonuclease Z